LAGIFVSVKFKYALLPDEWTKRISVGTETVVAKNHESIKSRPKAAGAKVHYRASASSRFVGVKDGIPILGPKTRSRHFTRKQAREAVDAMRSADGA
jgi:hypothetical protein